MSWNQGREKKLSIPHCQSQSEFQRQHLWNLQYVPEENKAPAWELSGQYAQKQCLLQCTMARVGISVWGRAGQSQGPIWFCISEKSMPIPLARPRSLCKQRQGGRSLWAMSRKLWTHGSICGTGCGLLYGNSALYEHSLWRITLSVRHICAGKHNQTRAMGHSCLPHATGV